MSEILNIIVTSNLFNFAILILIIILVIYKVDVNSILDGMKNRIKKSIDVSQSAKESAAKGLKDAKKSVKNLDNETKEIIENAHSNVENLKSHIMRDTQQKIENIEKNIQKILAAEEKQIRALLISKQGNKSVDKAKEEIIKRLNSNPDLHKRFIDDSIKQLNGAEL